MVKYYTSNTYICDCCGKEKTFCYKSREYGEDSCDEKEEYTDILISYPTDNNHGFNSHGINLCKECAKFVIDYLKENCNDRANWPEDL